MFGRGKENGEKWNEKGGGIGPGGSAAPGTVRLRERGGFQTATVLNGAGIAPYSLSQGEKDVLEAFGMFGRSKLIAFCGPEGASGLTVHVYRLGMDGTWEETGGGSIGLGQGASARDRAAKPARQRTHPKGRWKAHLPWSLGRITRLSFRINSQGLPL